MPTEPTPEDMSLDLESELRFATSGTMIPAWIAIAYPAVLRRAIAAERAGRILEAQLAERTDHAARLAERLDEMTRTAVRDTGELAEIIKAKDADLAEAVQLLRMIDDYERDKAIAAFLAKHEAKP